MQEANNIESLNYYNYFTEIEDTFIRRRGKHLLLSPIDWAMIEGWRGRGIPLHVVIRAIESVFDTFDKNPGPRTIKGLLYCREEVEAQYVEWSAAQVGRSPGETGDESQQSIGTEDILGHITASIERLRSIDHESLAEDIERVCSRLVDLSENLGDGLEIIDGSLNDIENFLDQALLSKSDSAHLKQIEHEIAGQLKAYRSDMDKDAFEQTRRLLKLKRLREDIGMPRLSLFYL